MRAHLAALTLALLAAPLSGCDPCEQTRPACAWCGPADGCERSTEVCVGEACESSDDCDEGAFCSNGACAPVLCG